MPCRLGFYGIFIFCCFAFSCSKRAVPKSELSRGKANNNSFPALTEFGEEKNLVSPSGQAIEGTLGTPDLLMARDDNALIFADTGNTVRPFEPVYFDFDQYVMKESEREKVIQLAQFMIRNRDARLLIEGYCDWKGTPAYNKSLGERRAQSVRTYLMELGADPQRIDTLSIGDETAIPSELSSETRLDRRAEFILSKGQAN